MLAHSSSIQSRKVRQFVCVSDTGVSEGEKLPCIFDACVFDTVSDISSYGQKSKSSFIEQEIKECLDKDDELKAKVIKSVKSVKSVGEKTTITLLLTLLAVMPEIMQS